MGRFPTALASSPGPTRPLLTLLRGAHLTGLPQAPASAAAADLLPPLTPRPSRLPGPLPRGQHKEGPEEGPRGRPPRVQGTASPSGEMSRACRLARPSDHRARSHPAPRPAGLQVSVVLRKPQLHRGAPHTPTGSAPRRALNPNCRAAVCRRATHLPHGSASTGQGGVRGCMSSRALVASSSGALIYINLSLANLCSVAKNMSPVTAVPPHPALGSTGPRRGTSAHATTASCPLVSLAVCPRGPHAKR